MHAGGDCKLCAYNLLLIFVCKICRRADKLAFLTSYDLLRMLNQKSRMVCSADLFVAGERLCHSRKFRVILQIHFFAICTTFT